MKTGHRHYLGTFVTLVAACTGGQSGNEGAHFFNDGGSSEGGHYCANARYEKLGWKQEATTLGVSPAEAFAEVDGTCTAPFVWDPNDGLTPSQGPAEVSIQVEVDRKSVREVLHKPDEVASGVCDNVLEAKAHVRIRTQDGVLDDEGEVILSYSPEGVTPFGFDVGQASFGGSLAVSLEKGQSASLSYKLDGTGNCAGEVSLWVKDPPTDAGVASAGGGPVGAWSSSGCGIGQRAVLADEPLEGGRRSPRAIVARAFEDVTLEGTWDDGEQTSLTLAAELGPVESLCVDPRRDEIQLPLKVHYGTLDGAIAMHAREVEAMLHTNAEGAFRYLTFFIDDDFECASKSDTALPYTLSSCAELTGVTIQVELNYDDHVSSNSEGLVVYEYLRGGGASPGAADRTRTLRLAPVD